MLVQLLEYMVCFAGYSGIHTSGKAVATPLSPMSTKANSLSPYPFRYFSDVPLVVTSVHLEDAYSWMSAMSGCDTRPLRVSLHHQPQTTIAQLDQHCNSTVVDEPYTLPGRRSGVSARYLRSKPVARGSW